MIVGLYLFPVDGRGLDLGSSYCFTLVLSRTKEIIDIGLSGVCSFIKFTHFCPVIQDLAININKINEIYCIKVADVLYNFK
jgi:hypothetical protein